MRGCDPDGAPARARSNLAIAAAMALGEALRQTNGFPTRATRS